LKANESLVPIFSVCVVLDYKAVKCVYQNEHIQTKHASTVPENRKEKRERVYKILHNRLTFENSPRPADLLKLLNCRLTFKITSIDFVKSLAFYKHCWWKNARLLRR
jgi:hypothetical protein